MEMETHFSMLAWEILWTGDLEDYSHGVTEELDPT